MREYTESMVCVKCGRQTDSTKHYDRETGMWLRQCLRCGTETSVPAPKSD